ncbi:MAG: hypothetical protein N3A69_01120, partial [Leptospiraceae bacterium]|nr:hypothetical protein [Leptospiraceae bacterium]
MKKLFLFSLILIFGLLSANCHKKKDDSQKNTLMLLGLYIADQQSGNCAVVSKNTSTNIYTAFLYPIPKGGCNAGTIYGGTTATEIKA